jgi:hypothetical protein
MIETCLPAGGARIEVQADIAIADDHRTAGAL